MLLLCLAHPSSNTTCCAIRRPPNGIIISEVGVTFGGRDALVAEKCPQDKERLAATGRHGRVGVPQIV